jgi:hypothetical protein
MWKIQSVPLHIKQILPGIGKMSETVHILDDLRNCQQNMNISGVEVESL